VQLSRNTKRRIVFYGGLGLSVAAFAVLCTAMPGHTFRSVPPPLDEREARYETEIRAHVRSLAGVIGARGTDRGTTLRDARDYVEGVLSRAGYAPQRHTYAVDGVSCDTVDVEISGTTRPREIVVVGAHYDSVDGAPGADDNASGVAGVLALAKALHGRKLARTVRFALFPNEEAPYFWTEQMGSLVYARELKARGDDVVAMLSLESIGYFSDRPGSQRYPPPVGLLYPGRGDFIAFVGNLGSRSLVRRSVELFRGAARVPSEGAALPRRLPGVAWSDQWAFWEVGYPGVMVTDTAPFRNPSYHTLGDVPATLDYSRCARVVAGVEAVVSGLAND
jgi:Zn-dependent M28 family amino/carboxypeptidase